VIERSLLQALVTSIFILGKKRLLIGYDQLTVWRRGEGKGKDGCVVGVSERLLCFGGGVCAGG